MSRPSSVTRLPEAIREKIAELRAQNCTLDEILEHLNKLNVEVSRSALGRHIKKGDEVAASVMKTRQMAEAISRQFGDKEGSQVARANMEILHGLLMKLMVGGVDDDKEVFLDAKDAMFAATALEKLAKASKSDLETQIKAAVEKERKAVTEEAATAAVKEARRQGLSKETADAIKSQILGI